MPSTNDAEPLARYKLLAARLVLPDGTRPLMVPCDHKGSFWTDTDGLGYKCPSCGIKGAATSPFALPPGLVPLLDLRQGQEVVPTSALMDACSKIFLDVSLWSNRNGEIGCYVGKHSTYSPSPNWEATLVDAATAALDALEAKALRGQGR